MSSQVTTAAASSAFLPLPTPTPVPSAQSHLTLSHTPLTPSTAAKFVFQSQLDLNSIRDTLIRLEESIIFALIERAQFRRNEQIYQPIHTQSQSDQTTPGDTTKLHEESILSRFLSATEALHASVRRYTSPCEHPFSSVKSLPEPMLPQLDYPQTIKQNDINHNDRIMKFYLGTVLPSICLAGDDSNYGSSCVCDVQALQLLSKRIHYGKFVAESKFMSDQATFTAAIRAHDIPALQNLITKPIIEEQVLQRVRTKAATYGKPPSLDEKVAPSSDPSSYKIPPSVISELYEVIMTMTKDVQIEYLLKRLD